MITEAQVALVQSSFVHVLPIADTAGQLLYGRIFTLALETRSLFDDDIAPQARRLMTAVKAAVDGLGNLEQIAPFLVKLGARHVRYGVRPEPSRSLLRRFCGHWSKASASSSLRTCARRGWLRGASSPTR